MKFEIKWPDTKMGLEHQKDFEGSFLFRASEIGNCLCCDMITRWWDKLLGDYVCSEECDRLLWTGQSEETDSVIRREKIKDELNIARNSVNCSKDIIIVVHNQLGYIRGCLQSIKDYTDNYQIYLWDNGSGKETREFLERECLASNGKIELIRSELNSGFIKPNNELVKLGDGEYIILLNSDTRVFRGWTAAMLGYLQQNPKVAQVGYLGGQLDEYGHGGQRGELGSNIDYLCGWCFCIKRDTYEEFGLFNKQLKFAYCEDADFSLRLKEAGRQIYALHSPLVYHFGNKTIKNVMDQNETEVMDNIKHNHLYMQHRWKDYLETQRVLLKERIPDGDII